MRQLPPFYERRINSFKAVVLGKDALFKGDCCSGASTTDSRGVAPPQGRVIKNVSGAVMRPAKIFEPVEISARRASKNGILRSAAFPLVVLLLLGPAVHSGVTVFVQGPVAHHMMAHIVLMNILAPLCASAAMPAPSERAGRLPRWSLASATTVQMALLWGLHAPGVLPATLASHGASVVANLALSLAAFWFWLSIFMTRAENIWRSVAALLITGKLFCLLGALLVFAPRPLFGCSSVICGPGTPGLEDQQLAGLLMVVACPLTYVAAGVICAARWLSELAARRPEGPLEWAAKGAPVGGAK